MKVCPNCLFSNDERFPTCVLCNRVLVDVPSTPSADPAHPEHERRKIGEIRERITRSKTWWASISFSLFITLAAAFPGLVLSPQILLLYLLSSCVVNVAVIRDVVGQLSAPILQGVLSLILVINFGPMQPGIFLMLVGHVTVTAVFWCWIDLIHSANR